LGRDDLDCWESSYFGKVFEYTHLALFLFCALRNVLLSAMRREIASLPAMASPEILPILDSEKK
jgi:hypothetical protein